MNRRLKRCLMGIILSFIAVAAMATSQKKLLIINSYDEAEPWANDMASPIAMYLAGIDSVSGYIVNLDNALINDSVAYNKMVNNVFSQYEDDQPEYVVMLGNFAFTLRDRIQEEWGDIPMLLISRISTFGTLEDNFCSRTEPVPDHYGTPLETVRDQYNFTTIIVPDLYKDDVDLMVQLNPEMQELVYISTNTYVSRNLAYDIENHIKATHPGLKFSWLHASRENSVEFQDIMVTRSYDKGYLLASWVYEKETARGFNTLTSNDLRLLPSSKSPIFALRESYVSRGCVGGVYVDEDGVKEHILGVVHEMLRGKSMRNIPFYTVDNKTPKLNYRLLMEYGISEELCPAGTYFYNKPATYWEKYLWQSITGILLLIVFMGFVWWKIYKQNCDLTLARNNERFINNMPVPFAKADINYDNQGKVRNIVYSNKNDAFELLIANNSMPDNPFLLFPADFISEKTEMLLHTGKNVKFTYHFDKTDTWYNFTLCNVLSNKKEKGEIQSVVDVFANNITDRIKLESQLRSIANKLQLALSVSRTVPWQWNLQTGKVNFDDMEQLGRTTSRKVMSDNGREEWQITFEDFIRRIHPEDRHMLTSLRDNVRNGTTTNSQLQMRMYKALHSDDIDWIQIYSAVTDKTDDGSPIVTGTLKIITDQKQAEEDMAAAKERAEESDRMKSAFLANMSHEIRTPLNAIVGFSNLIADTTEEAERMEFKDIINTNSDLLLTLINDVLDLAKIESNTIDINYAVGDINAILQSVEQSIKIRVQPGVRLNMVLGCDKCLAETDAVRLSQILINMLTNACKFTERGSITFGYMLQNNDTLYFYVSDTGIGISAENKKRVFERFVKLNSFAQGTGLGLSICQRLVEIMGGEIGVDSEGLGRGSRFWFTLPYVAHNEEESHNDMDITLVSSASASTAGIDKETTLVPQNANKPVMLVAEDHDSNFKLIAHLMKDRYTFVRATNGKDAITLFRQHHPDIILMDINMPIMDGYEAVSHIRKEDKHVPIIAVTAYAYASDKMRIMNSGFDAYVPKPVSQKAINEVLARLKNGGARKHR